MKVIIHAVAIVVLLGAAYLTLQHRSKFAELEETRLNTIAKNKAITEQAVTEEAKLAAAKQALAAAEQKREEQTQAKTSLESNATKLQREAEDLDATLKTQDSEFAELNKTRENLANILKDLGQDITLENLGDKIQQIDADLKEKKTKLEELETLSASSSKALATTRAEIDRLVKREIDRNANIGRNSMEAVVTAVNQDWGFLVIGAGSNSGFTPQTGLLVQRNGRLIGRVTPSAIEPTQTIGEIDFDSVGSGVRLQPGDRVILAKPSGN
jgi:myosin heavy subunit